MKQLVSLTLALASGCAVSELPPEQEEVQPGRLTAAVDSSKRGNEEIAAIPAVYRIEAVPTDVPYGRSAAGRIICDTGAIVGTTDIGSFAASHAIVWDASGGVTDLGTLGGTISSAAGGNAAGTVVGSSATAGNGNGHAFSYQGGVMTDLEGIGGQYSYATAVNESEQVVGAATIPGVGDVDSHAVLWESCGRAIDLGGLPGGTTYSWARDINEAGVIAGSAIQYPNQSRAVIWRDRRIVDLGAGGAFESQATAINEAGTVTGFTRLPDRAVIWNDQGVMTDLGTLGGDYALALGLNDRGAVVGMSTPPGNPRQHAFLYEAGVMVDLNLFVDQSRWWLGQANGICDDGRIIGNGTLDGVTRGFVMTPLAVP